MSHEDSEATPQFPETGFYHHYKHDLAGEVNNYAYEVLGVGYHTEDDCRPIDQYLVFYRPLYDAFVYRVGKGKLTDARPLSMFMERVTRDGVTKDRFTKITNEATLKELTAIRNSMYP